MQGSKAKPSDASQLHPLDPLTPDEVIVAAKTCKAYAEKEGVSPLRFNAITLQVSYCASHFILHTLQSNLLANCISNAHSPYKH